MPRKKPIQPEQDGTTPTECPWSQTELLAVKHLGPGIIGQAMYDAAQQYATETKGGVFGPALLATE